LAMESPRVTGRGVDVTDFPLKRVDAAFDC